MDIPSENSSHSHNLQLRVLFLTTATSLYFRGQGEIFLTY